MNKQILYKVADLADRTPAYSLIANDDQVIMLYDDDMSELSVIAPIDVGVNRAQHLNH